MFVAQPALAQERKPNIVLFLMDNVGEGNFSVYGGTVRQMGTVVGTFSCSNGNAGSFTAYELQVTELSIIGRFTASSSTLTGCQATGWFGGLTVTTF